jgi:hypothetical protein
MMWPQRLPELWPRFLHPRTAHGSVHDIEDHIDSPVGSAATLPENRSTLATKGGIKDMKPKTITDSKIVSAKFKVANAILIAAFLAFGFVPPSNAQNNQKDSPQNPVVLKNMGGAGQTCSQKTLLRC